MYVCNLCSKVCCVSPTWRCWSSHQPYSGVFVLATVADNNMWMVVDTKLFTPGVPLPNGTLTILEQLPGYTQAADLTHILRYGYFPSYNRAYFAQTRALSGEAQMVRITRGLWLVCVA